MKIYDPKERDILRISILKRDDGIEYINIVESTKDEFIEFAERVLKSKSVESEKYRTRINVRSYKSGINLKSITYSLKTDLSNTEVKEILVNAVNEGV